MADKCSGFSKGERNTRKILERIFGSKFPCARPEFLINSDTGHCMELDCYNEELRLAVEFNGKQHYEYTPIFHKDELDFIDQQIRDENKKRLCQNNNIDLIVVSYDVENIEKYILDQLTSLGYDDYVLFYIDTYGDLNDLSYNELKRFARRLNAPTEGGKENLVTRLHALCQCCKSVVQIINYFVVYMKTLQY